MTHAALQLNPMSLDDFEELLADQPEDERWELIDGRVVRMVVGARWEHNRIISNLHFEIRQQIERTRVALSCLYGNLPAAEGIRSLVALAGSLGGVPTAAARSDIAR